MSEKIQYGIDTDEYVKNNPLMEYTNMKIEKISPECSEISMKITHGVTNLMGMVHGGMLYALADVVTGLTARADGKKYVSGMVELDGWQDWKKLTIDNIRCKKGNVKIGIYVDHAADGWGMIDDFYFGQE